MRHVLERHEKCDRPYPCPICDGGLASCTVCGGAEGDLTTDCPGVRVSADTQDKVYRGELDFVGGKWLTRQPQTD